MLLAISVLLTFTFLILSICYYYIHVFYVGFYLLLVADSYIM